MSKINIFCFGFGQVAECFINKIIQEKKRNIELLIKEFNREKNLDPELVESLAKAKSKGYESWQEAKRKSQFKIFLPFFKELIAELNKALKFIK